MNEILSRAESDALRDACMSSVAEHQNDYHEGWGDVAYGYLCGFASQCDQAAFTAEVIVNRANANPTFPNAVDDRAWGAVFKRALRDGVIEVCGTGRSLRRHSSITNLYISKVFRP